MNCLRTGAIAARQSLHFRSVVRHPRLFGATVDPQCYTRNFVDLAVSSTPSPTHTTHTPPNSNTELQNADRSNSPNVEQPTTRQLRIHMLGCAIPMVGFGMMDNFIMIQAGDMIDNTLGVTFGLATLTAAALGQVCSDFFGVCFGGWVDAVATWLGVPHSGMTRQQLGLRRVKFWGTLAAGVGVVLGCTIGMTSLFFKDLERSERLKKQQELHTLFMTIMKDSTEVLDAEMAKMWVLDKDGKSVWSLPYMQPTYEPSDEELRVAFANYDKRGAGRISAVDIWNALRELRIDTDTDQVKQWVRRVDTSKTGTLDFEEFKLFLKEMLNKEEVRVTLKEGGLKSRVISTGQLINLRDPYNTEIHGDAMAKRDRYFGYRRRSMILAPIIDRENGKVLGVIEVINKQGQNPGYFDHNDEKLLTLLGHHASVFIHQCGGIYH